MFDSNQNGHSQKKWSLLLLFRMALSVRFKSVQNVFRNQMKTKLRPKICFHKLTWHSGSYSRSVIVAIATHKQFLVANPHQGHSFIQRRPNLAKQIFILIQRNKCQRLRTNQREMASQQLLRISNLGQDNLYKDKEHPC